MKIKKDLVLRNIGEEYFIVDPSQDMVDLSTVFSLNRTAAWLWEKLAGVEFSEACMVALLREEYKLSEEQAEKDAQEFIGLLGENNLLSS